MFFEFFTDEKRRQFERQCFCVFYVYLIQCGVWTIVSNVLLYTQSFDMGVDKIGRRQGEINRAKS